ncbi:hypothetical protein BJ508DRAFT_97385 [Ascobolus immersus RN42]|uniref:F-box domain-containing protein n=1 Tax=Ascobolus immersus RN42 TaxID=1160509 RepID=A0A3N4IR45_ASCIM|nr:hypothetical protein BJ508DRAFT_97385 [Ascobolus immersus RN42]
MTSQKSTADSPRILTLDRITTRLSQTPRRIPSHGFLCLPTELRIKAYKYCNAFSLLQLSHTSPFLYQEINSIPSLWTRERQYYSCSLDDEWSTYGLFSGRDKPDPGPVRLGIIRKVQTNSEVELFWNLYPITEKCKEKDFQRLTCCPHCRVISNVCLENNRMWWDFVTRRSQRFVSKPPCFDEVVQLCCVCTIFILKECEGEMPARERQLASTLNLDTDSVQTQR